MSYGDLDIRNTGKYLKIENGQPHDVRLLDETPFEKTIHGFGKEATICQGDDCTECAEGDEPKQRFMANVYDHGLKKALIWEFGSGVAKQLKAIDNALGEEERKIVDVDLKVDSSGEKMTKKYMITPRMTAKPIPPGLKTTDFSLPF